MQLQLISSVLYTGSRPPSVPRNTQSTSSGEVDSGPSPYMDMIDAYMKERNGGDTYAFMNPLLNSQFENFEQVTLPKELLSKTDMGAVLRQASDMPKPVPGYQHRWTSDPFLEYSVTMPSTQEEVEARYTAALGNGMTLEEAQQLLKDQNSGKGNSFAEAYSSVSQREREDFRTVAESGTVVTLVTPRMPVIGSENFSLRLTRQSGMEMTLPLNEDARINEYENGYLSLYYPATGVRKTFDAAGNAVDAQDVENWGATGQNIIVNVTGDSVVTGDGNDIIYNTADNTRIEGSGGNKTVFMLGAKNEGCTLDLGDGNNTVFGDQLTNTDFKLGTGKNSLMLLSVKGGSIIGNGPMSLVGYDFSDMNVENLSGFSSISCDKLGNSSVMLQGGSHLEMTLAVNSVVKLGDENNTMRIRSLDYTQVDAGHGKNNISIESMGSSHVSLGNGNNSLNITSMHGNPSVTTLNGNNYIYIERGNGTISTGSGNDTLYLPNSINRDSANISLGSGRNTVYTRDHQSGEYTDKYWAHR